MPAFLSTIPVWMLVLAGIILAYALYRYWKYKKATAYAPNIARGTTTDTFTSLRDQPKIG